MVATTPTPGQIASASLGWTIVARLIILMTFLQPMFIGLMFSGYRDGLNAHRINAYALFLLAAGSLIVAIATQRNSPVGRKLVSELAGFTVALTIVAVIGMLSHAGYRLHWLHFPAGAAMIAGAIDLQATVGGLRQRTTE